MNEGLVQRRRKAANEVRIYLFTFFNYIILVLTE